MKTIAACAAAALLAGCGAAPLPQCPTGAACADAAAPVDLATAPEGPVVCNCPNVPVPNCGVADGPAPCYCPTAIACPDGGAADLATPAMVCTPNCNQCLSGVCCGGGCCASGEWCDNGTCRCGTGAACGARQICAAGPIQPGQTCGFICCGGGVPCPL